MEKLILAFIFIVLPMILNALDQKKKREAERRLREGTGTAPRPASPPRGAGAGGPSTLEDWIETMQRKGEQKAELPPARPARPTAPPRPVPPPPRAPQPVARPVGERPAERRPETTEAPPRADRPTVRTTSARSRPSRSTLTAAERSKKRNAERKLLAELEPVQKKGRSGRTKDSARRAPRARTAVRESDRSTELKARRAGKGGASIEIGGRDDLRRAFIMKDVLSLPKALKDI